MTRRPNMDWTPEIDQYIRENYKKMSMQQMADELDITLGVLRGHYLKLKLKKCEKKNYKSCGYTRFPDSVRKNLGIN
jgi:hypothetical protein